MRRQDFHYDLPTDLIAQRPLAQRSSSRLLCLDGATHSIVDRRSCDLPGLLRSDDLLVFNDTRVIPARLFGRKTSGGAVEILIERIVDVHTAWAQVRASKSVRIGMPVRVADAADVTAVAREGGFFKIKFTDAKLPEFLYQHGHVPLPPYMQRADEPQDQARYQTVYARVPGAVAAPTAGMHFDAGLLQTLGNMGVRQAFLTLHIGAATFQPMRTDDLRDHTMHSEWTNVSQEVCRAVLDTRARGGRVIAVGTTTVRSLETAAAGGSLRPFSGETALFIYPGFQFRVIDALITNFHLPESTLLMLVAAFAGREAVLAAYHHAVENRYRFFSYGDAMFVTPKPGVRQR